MNFPEILSHIKTQVTQTKNKFSLALFAVLIVRSAYQVLYWLLFALFGAGRFFTGISNLLSVLNDIAIIVLGVYLIVLFVRKKQALHLASGILLIVACLIGGWLSSICWLAFVVCIALPSLKNPDETVAGTAKLTLLAAAVSFVLSLLSGFLWGMPRFLCGILLMIFAAVNLVQIVLVAAVFLGEAQDGEAKASVNELVSKVKNRSASPAQPQVEVAPSVADAAAPVEVSASVEAPAPVETPVETEVAPSVAAAAPAEIITEAPAAVSGSHVGYQYKTVAGPVGLTISKNTNYADGVTNYAAIIAQESYDGWVFDSIHEIPVTKNNGCIAALMGRGSTTVYFNMLIFRREIR